MIKGGQEEFPQQGEEVDGQLDGVTLVGGQLGAEHCVVEIFTGG